MFLTVTNTPTNVTSYLTGDYKLQLSWSAPASNTPSIVGYEVFYAASGSDVTQSGGITNSSTTAINVTLPNPSGIYDFFVVAFSDADNALPSARSSNSTVVLTELGSFIKKPFPIDFVFVARWPCTCLSSYLKYSLIMLL